MQHTQRYDALAALIDARLNLARTPVRPGTVRFYRDRRLVQLGDDVTGAKANVAAAYAIALHDLRRDFGGDHEPDPAAAHLAMERLLPLELLGFSLLVNEGGITAVANDLHVLPVTVRTRLDSLTTRERARFNTRLDAMRRADAYLCDTIPTPRAAKVSRRRPQQLAHPAGETRHGTVRP